MAQAPKKEPEIPAKQNPGDNVANRYFSVSVTPTSLPSSLLSLPLGEGASDTVSYNYLRLGAPDNKFEGRLPPNPEETNEKGESEESPWEDGLLLYTTGKYQVIAPSTSETTAESFEAVHDGKSLYSAEYTAADVLGSAAMAALGAVSISYKHLNEMSAQLGTSLDTILGIEQKFWTGISTKLGSGSEMIGTVGTDIRVAGAKEIHLETDWARVLFGGVHEEATKNHNVFSQGPIRLSSNPVANKAAAGTLTKVATLIKRFVVMLAAVAPSLLTATVVSQNLGTWADTQDEGKLKTSMQATALELLTLMGLSTILQVAVTLGAALMRLAGTSAAIAAGVESPTSSILLLQPEGGPNSSYLKAGTRQLMFDAVGDILLANGVAGPQIALTQDSVTLGVGASSITLTDAGITITGPQVTCEGGESSLMLGAAGATLSGPEVKMLPTDPDAIAKAAGAEAAFEALLAAFPAAKEAAADTELATWIEEAFG